MSRRHEIDMTEGVLAPKIMKFTIPYMLSGMLQTMFNAADNAVIGAFDGSNALAAVGSTGSITHFVINLLMGLSVGTNVIMAKSIGASQKKSCEEAVHSAIFLSLVVGLFLGLVSCLSTRFFLTMINCPPEVMELADVYLKIFFMGIPATSAFNFGSAILRSKGDTQRPLIYLSIAGVVNIVLNLVLVVKFKLSTAGVGIATTVSQYLSAFLTIRALTKEDDVCHLDIRRIRFIPHMASKLLKIGVPASIQGLMFSISNISIQGSVNTFGANAMAGVGAAASLNGIVYNTIAAFGQSSLAFTGQNYGAKKFDRIKNVYLWSSVLMLMCWAVVALIIRSNLDILLRIFLPHNEKALEFAMTSAMMLSATYFIAGLMEISVGMLRGLGRSTIPAIISVFGICGIRLVWLATAFKKYNSFLCLYISYPVTWTITTLALVVYFVFVYKKTIKIHK